MKLSKASRWGTYRWQPETRWLKGKFSFGIKAVSELGPLKVTTVVSQQRGESNTQSISGGSQENTIELRPADYEDGRHFFLDFYNRQEFERAV